MSGCKNCGQPQEGPNLVKKTINLGKAMFNHIIDGLGATPTEIQEERISKCRMCPYRHPTSIDLVCTHQDCGCYIETKVTWASEECPIGLWGKYTDNKDLDENNDVNTPQS